MSDAEPRDQIRHHFVLPRLLTEPEPVHGGRLQQLVSNLHGQAQ